MDLYYLRRKECLYMQQERKIKLHSLQEVKDFVLAATTCEFDVDVCYNRVVVDGKSILGVLGMDLNRVLTVQFSGCNNGFEDILDKYSVA